MEQFCNSVSLLSEQDDCLGHLLMVSSHPSPRVEARAWLGCVQNHDHHVVVESVCICGPRGVLLLTPDTSFPF